MLSNSSAIMFNSRSLSISYTLVSWIHIRRWHLYVHFLNLHCQNIIENCDGSWFFEKRTAIFFAPKWSSIFIFTLVYKTITQYLSTSFGVNIIEKNTIICPNSETRWLKFTVAKYCMIKSFPLKGFLFLTHVRNCISFLSLGIYCSLNDSSL